MTLRECAEVLGTTVRKMPLWPYRALAKVMWRLRLSEAPPGQIDFALYPWIVSNEKLKATLDWTPRSHVPRDLRDHDAGPGQAARRRTHRCP